MDIGYVENSKFLEDCEQVIRSSRHELDNGESLNVEIETGGYDGRVTVDIIPDERGHFRTDWERSDSTRFPARIKAAATALFNCSCFGRFTITHKDGTIAIIKE